MLSLITVNWKANDFTNLLRESIEIFTHTPYELIVIDNTNNNIGHGAGLNLGVQKASQEYVMFLDCDTHFLKHHWEEEFLNSNYDVIAAKGVPAKPIRPACLFMKKNIAKKYDWRATEGYQGHRITPEGMDVAIAAYYQMLKDNVSIQFLNTFPNRYGTYSGEEYGFNEPLIYHHWHGASIHLACRQADFPKIDLIAEKNKLFSNIGWRMP